VRKFGKLPLLVLNAKELFELLIGNANICGPAWKKMVKKSLLGLPISDNLYPVSEKKPFKERMKAQCQAFPGKKSGQSVNLVKQRMTGG
jgi:hypothetical protein